MALDIKARRRPWELEGLAVLILGDAFVASFLSGAPVRGNFLFGADESSLLGFFDHLECFPVIGFSAIAALFLLYASSWSLVFFPASIISGVYRGWVLSDQGRNAAVWIPTLVSALLLLAMGGFLLARMRQLLFRPKCRWWLTPARIKMSLPVRLSVFGNKSVEIRSRTFDISEGGAFIPLTAPPPEIAVGCQCFITLPIAYLFFAQYRAVIVRSCGPVGRYPAGIAVQFLGVSWRERRRLRSCLNLLVQRGEFD